MTLKLKHWAWGVALATYALIGAYLAYGAWRCVEVASHDTVSFTRNLFFDAWWLTVCEGLGEEPLLTVALLLSTAYLAIGIVRATFALGVEWKENHKPAVAYSAPLDLWWSEVYYWIFHREPFRC